MYNLILGAYSPDSYMFSLLFLGGVKAIAIPKIEMVCPFETKTYKIVRRKGI